MAPCTALGPCSFVCSGGNGSTHYDLSGFKSSEPASGYYTVVDTDGHHYYFDACGPISAVTCEGSTLQSPAAIQTWGSQPPVFPSDCCASVGDYSTQICHEVGSALQCDYTGGDDSRSVSIKYTCGPAYLTPTADQPGPDQPPHYEIQLVGPAACASASAAATSSLTIGGSLVGAALLAYIPQVVILLSRHSSEGLSQLTPAIAMVGAFLDLCSTSLVSWPVRVHPRKHARAQ